MKKDLEQIREQVGFIHFALCVYLIIQAISGFIALGVLIYGFIK